MSWGPPFMESPAAPCRLEQAQLQADALRKERRQVSAHVYTKEGRLCARYVQGHGRGAQGGGALCTEARLA